MLALLHIAVPFDLTVPEGDEFRLWTYEEDGYKITFGAPASTGKPPLPFSPEHVKINGRRGIQVDVITIVFQKESFDRGITSQIDPPEKLIKRTLRSFLERLKYAVKAPQVKIINFPDCPWKLSYTNDDGSELEKREGLLRGRGSLEFPFLYIGCDSQLWDLIFSLPNDFEAPAWHTLLIDSRGVLPHIGTALVLAATALEVFIADLLDRLAKETAIPRPLWNWINNRGNWQKEPSVEEQFDILLKVLSGHSLKEDNDLWEGLKNLRSARNSFVHEGVAKLGGIPLSIADTLKLIERADSVVAKVREWIPEIHRWPVFLHAMHYEITKQITWGANTAVARVAPEAERPSP